jgi:hypothetical protein
MVPPRGIGSLWYGPMQDFSRNGFGAFGERAIALHYRGSVNRGGAQAGDSPDTIYGLARSDTGVEVADVEASFA